MYGDDRDLSKEVLSESSMLLKEAAQKIAQLEEELAYYRKKEWVYKIASKMEEKNISPPWGQTRDEAIEYLMKLPHKKLATMEEAVDLVAPNSSLGDVEGEESETTGEEPNIFDQYLMGMLD